MNAGTIRTVAALTATALAASGCAQLTPGENAAVFGGTSGIAAGALARAAGMSTAESIATGAAVGAVVAVTTFIIAKHQATERQRQVAEQRARAAYARMQAQRRAEERRIAQEERTESQRRTTQSSTSGRRTAKPKARAAKRVPRYIAVDTVKDERTSPKAKKSVMIFDTQSQEIVGNNVYDVENTPPVGSTAKFETYSAEYVGASL